MMKTFGHVDPSQINQLNDHWHLFVVTVRGEISIKPTKMNGGKWISNFGVLVISRFYSNLFDWPEFLSCSFVFRLCK